MGDEASVRIVETEELIRGSSWRASVEVSWSEAKTVVEITEPSSAEDEKLITWFLEDYAITDPFDAGKATKARNTLRQYGRQLFENVFGNAVPAFRRLSIFVVSGSEVSQFQKLHWELLEDHLRYFQSFSFRES